MLDELAAAARPANISLLADGPLSSSERDIYRAEKCRDALKAVHRADT